MSPSEMSLTASRMSSLTGDRFPTSLAGVGEDDLNPFLSGVLCLIWLPFVALGDRLLGDLDLLDPLIDLDRSRVLNLGDGDREPFLEDLGDSGLRDPEEFKEVLSKSKGDLSRDTGDLGLRPVSAV